MAGSQTVPLPGTALQQHNYDNSYYKNHQFQSNIVGIPGPLLVALSANSNTAGAIVTGNGAYPIFIAPVPSNLFTINYTIVTAGTGAGSNLQAYLISANNGANVSSNIALGNLVTTGVNAAGNCLTTGPVSYNAFANGVISGSNNALVVKSVSVNTGDIIVVVSTGNTLCALATVEWAPQGGSSIYG